MSETAAELGVIIGDKVEALIPRIPLSAGRPIPACGDPVPAHCVLAGDGVWFEQRPAASHPGSTDSGSPQPGALLSSAS